MIQVASFVFNDFQENTYMLWDHTKECVIIDPGCFTSSENKLLEDYIFQNQLVPVKLVNTHCHIDHVLGNNFVSEKYQIPLYLHEKELITYKEVGRWAAMFNINPGDIPQNRIYLNEGDELTFGESVLQTALTPGHSIASLSFFNLEQKIAIVGDVLFYESIGRTDLPGGNFETLISSIKTKLFNWNDDTKIYSGHGPQTTIGHEKMFNPFLS